jgi:hypothetical protein
VSLPEWHDEHTWRGLSPSRWPFRRERGCGCAPPTRHHPMSVRPSNASGVRGRRPWGCCGCCRWRQSSDCLRRCARRSDCALRCSIRPRVLRSQRTSLLTNPSSPLVYIITCVFCILNFPHATTCPCILVSVFVRLMMQPTFTNVSTLRRSIQ